MARHTAAALVAILVVIYLGGGCSGGSKEKPGTAEDLVGSWKETTILPSVDDLDKRKLAGVTMLDCSTGQFEERYYYRLQNSGNTLQLLRLKPLSSSDWDDANDYTRTSGSTADIVGAWEYEDIFDDSLTELLLNANGTFSRTYSEDPDSDFQYEPAFFDNGIYTSTGSTFTLVTPLTYTATDDRMNITHVEYLGYELSGDKLVHGTTQYNRTSGTFGELTGTWEYQNPFETDILQVLDITATDMTLSEYVEVNNSWVLSTWDGGTYTDLGNVMAVNMVMYFDYEVYRRKLNITAHNPSMKAPYTITGNSLFIGGKDDITLTHQAGSGSSVVGKWSATIFFLYIQYDFFLDGTLTMTAGLDLGGSILPLMTTFLRYEDDGSVLSFYQTFKYKR